MLFLNGAAVLAVSVVLLVLRRRATIDSRVAPTAPVTTNR